MEAHGGERRYSSYSYLTSALDGGKWSASRPGRALTPTERTPGTHWIGGWVGLRTSLDAGARRKILCPRRGSNLDHPARSQIMYCLSYRGSIYFINILNIGIRKNNKHFLNFNKSTHMLQETYLLVL
jgi:hypothetical protein